MTEGREALTLRLEQQLGTLVSSVEIAIRNNLASSNVVAETTLAGLLNRVYGWNLVNANAISQNYPGVDLIDAQQNIAVQVSSTRTKRKVRCTLEAVAGLGVTFEKLIILLISNESASKYMKACTVPGYSGPMEIWSIPDVFRDARELNTEKLGDITVYMAKELGTVAAKLENLPRLELPLSSTWHATGFVGRKDELEEIRSRFAIDDLVVLTGLGGIGKTELAMHYGRKHPGLVHFVRFDKSFSRTLANMALGIRPTLTDEELRQDEGVLSKKVLNLLERSSPEDLLIIDNADSETGTLADLQRDTGYKAIRKLPLKLLLTTRSEAPRAIRVDPMPEEPLFEVFRNHGANLTEAEMKALIRAVNGHTLTIDLIARTLNGTGWRKITAEKMLTSLQENTLPSQKYRKIATDYNQSTEQAQIYEHLSVVFDVSGIPVAGQSVMRCATLLPEGGMDSECFGMSLNEDEQEALDTILVHGWLEVKNDLLTIHPVIRLVCRTELEPTGESCEVFLDKLWAQYDLKEYHPARYSQMAELFTLAHDRLGNQDGRWLNRSGILWHKVGQHQLLHDLYDSRLPALEQALSQNPTELAKAYNYYGLSLDSLGRYSSALSYSKRALTIRREVLSENDPDLAHSYNNVGSAYGELGDHSMALEYLLKALTILEKASPPEHPDIARSYNNIGTTYGNLGNHNKALEYQLKALAIWEGVLPPEHPDLATSYNNVGGTYSSLGNHNKALEYQLKALGICEKALPPEHPNLALFYNNIGSTYGNLGYHNKALEYKQKALVIREKALPPEHPDLATSYNNVGGTYSSLGNHNKALEYQLKALAIQEMALPPEHPNLALFYNNVGGTYGELGDHRKALEYLVKALAIQEMALPPEHPSLAVSCNNIAWTHHNLGNLPAAAQYMRRAADIISRSSLPKTHPARVNYPKWAVEFEQEAKMQQAILAQQQAWGSTPFPLIKK